MITVRYLITAAAMEHTVMMPFMYTIKINGKNRITAQDKALCGTGKVQSLYLAHLIAKRDVLMSCTYKFCKDEGCSCCEGMKFEEIRVELHNQECFVCFHHGV